MRRCAACGAGLAAEAKTCDFCGSLVTEELRLICPRCFVRNPDEARFCTGCGAELTPEEPAAADVERICPVCDRPLTPRTVAGGVPAHECRGCHGLWLPGRGLSILLDRAKGARAAGARRHRAAFSSRIVYRRCPVCGTPMHRKNYGRRSGVIIDWCREHGVWLDADELEDIAVFHAEDSPWV